MKLGLNKNRTTGSNNRWAFFLSLILVVSVVFTACGSAETKPTETAPPAESESVAETAANSEENAVETESVTETAADSENAKDKYKIYLNLSYSGNAWSNECANMIEALTKTPPYDEMIEFKKIISGQDIQKQISDLQSMIEEGADAILCYPLSPSALNGVIDQAKEAGILFFCYDSTVTNPYAYNVSVLTAGMGQNTAQFLVNALGGKGKIFFNRGVPGTAIDTARCEGALSVFAKYPEIEIVADYTSNWDQVQAKTNTLNALAANPEIDGIWSQDGEYGVLEALEQFGHKYIPVTGENSNGFRNAILEKNEEGLISVSSGSSPTVGAYTLKLAMGLLTGSLDANAVPHNIEYPLPWQTIDSLEMGVNVFSADEVPTSFVADITDDLVPETNVDSALNGTPVPGMTIHDLTLDDIKQAVDVPGINSETDVEPEDLYAVNEELVVPIPVPQ